MTLEQRLNLIESTLSSIQNKKKLATQVQLSNVRLEIFTQLETTNRELVELENTINVIRTKLAME